MIGVSIIVISVFIGILVALIKPKWFLYLLIFFAGWHSISIDIGLSVTIYRLIIIIFLICLPWYLLLNEKRFIPKFPSSMKLLFIFIFYAIAVTLIARFFVPEAYITGFTRGEGRLIFQIAKFLIEITPAFLPLLFFKKIEDIKTAGKVFVTSTTILCTLGWVQSLAFYLYRVNLFPLFREGLLSKTEEVITIEIAGMTFHRMHSLGGEPKSFSITVAVAIFLLIIYKIINSKDFRFGNLLIFFFLISLFMSFATSGYVIFLMGLTLLVILPLFIKSLSYKLVFKQIIFFAVMAIIFLGIIISSGILTIDIAETLILSRTIYRMPIELFDAAALDFLLKNPQCGLFGVGMGNIHIYAWHNLLQHALNNPYDSWVIPHAYNFAFIPNSGYLEIISGLGIIGLILFLSTGLIPIRFNLKYRLYTHDKNVNDTGLALSLFCPFILIVYLMRFYQINFVYITLGLLYFFNYKAREFCSICNENGFDA